MVYRKDTRVTVPVANKAEGCPAAQRHEIVSLEHLFGAGRLLSELVLVPGAQIPVHTHTGEFEVFLILSGEATYFDNGETIILAPGDVALCKEGETHGIANKSDRDMTLVAFIGYPAPAK